MAAGGVERGVATALVEDLTTHAADHLSREAGTRVNIEPEIRTAAGVVRGSRENDVAVFRGIPYAEPPVGARRFGAPVPVRRWDGIRDALRFGPPVPQGAHTGSVMSSVSGNVDDGSADCLTLNLWSPDLGAGRLPVMVWIQGGTYLENNCANPHQNGATLARAGVVLVSMNYRVGVDGFAHITGAPGNRGILDQIAALRWVQDISAHSAAIQTTSPYSASPPVGRASRRYWLCRWRTDFFDAR